MRLGIIARCDSRGIAYQTLEACRGLNPSKVLVVRMNERRWPEDPSRFTPWDATVIDSHPVSRSLDVTAADKFLDGLDAVFSVETLYDWDIANRCRQRGIKTVIQGNPEFYVHHLNDLRLPGEQLAHPDLWVWPTTWMFDDGRLPNNHLLPVPAPTVAAQPSADPEDETLRILHVAGHAALGDRNGTLVFANTLPLIGTKVHVTMVGQDGALPATRPSKWLTFEANPKGVKDRWDLYRNQHLVILPRRYGGLCLPAIEACTQGVVPLMPAAPENSLWPIHGLPAQRARLQRTPGGRVPTWAVRPNTLAAEIDKINRNRGLLGKAQSDCLKWARSNTWDKWRAEYERAFS